MAAGGLGPGLERARARVRDDIRKKKFFFEKIVKTLKKALKMTILAKFGKFFQIFQKKIFWASGPKIKIRGLTREKSRALTSQNVETRFEFRKTKVFLDP